MWQASGEVCGLWSGQVALLAYPAYPPPSSPASPHTNPTHFLPSCPHTKPLPFLPPSPTFLTHLRPRHNVMPMLYVYTFSRLYPPINAGAQHTNPPLAKPCPGRPRQAWQCHGSGPGRS